ncbi:MAG: hypothetical protein IPG71_03070 [bacterium]|nr:hypothetical protein [bacterium]
MATQRVTKGADYTLARGKIGFTLATTMRAPLKKVWEAATQAKHVEKFFVHKVKGDFNAQFEPVFWTWPSHGTFPLYPVAFAQEKYLEFYWPLHGSKGKLSLVRFDFSEKKGLRGWRSQRAAGARAAYPTPSRTAKAGPSSATTCKRM